MSPGSSPSWVGGPWTNRLTASGGTVSQLERRGSVSGDRDVVAPVKVSSLTTAGAAAVTPSVKRRTMPVSFKRRVARSNGEDETETDR